MRLGIDLDGVIFSFVEACRQVFPSIPKDPTDVDLLNYLNPEEKRQFYYLLKNARFFRNLPLIPGVKDIVPYLNTHELWVITSRQREVHDATREAIKELGLNPVEILFRHKKAKTVRDYNLDVYVDDQVKHIEPLPPEQIALMPDLGYNREFVKRAMDEGRMVIPYYGADQLKDFLIKLEGIK